MEGKTSENNWFWDSLESNDELKSVAQDKPDKEMNWLCGLCYVWCHEEQDLEAHMKEVHINSSRFQKCRYCDKKFLARFLCLRHEKLHKFDMNRPMSHYYPQGKPKDYYVSNHFSNSVKRAKFSRPYESYIMSLTNRVGRQIFECLQCEKIFEEEELLREHFDVTHAVQQCIYCLDYFESFTVLRKHQRAVHDYEYKTREPGDAWLSWEKEREAAHNYNQLTLSHLAFFHSYARSSNEEPIQENAIPKPVHLRKAIFPSSTINRNSIRKSFDAIANEISKNKLKQGQIQQSPQIKSYENEEPVARKTTVPGTHPATPNTANPLSAKTGHKVPLTIENSKKPSLPLDCNRIESPGYNGTILIPSKIVPQKVRSSSPSSGLRNTVLDKFTKPLTEFRAEIFHQSEAIPEKPDLQDEISYSEPTSPINEAEFEEYESDSSYLSDTPPKLDLMVALDEEEARDPEEEVITESIPYNDDDDDMLIIEENLNLPTTLPTQCHICDMQYEDPKSMERHIRAHAGGRPFSCQFCGQGFSSHSNRKEHERIHTGERPYVCLYCQKGFTQISNLKKHISTHKEQNLRCLKCEKQFVKESSLILHQRAHAADRRFRCHICDRAYNYASLLKRHMRIHTGELPYECDMCGMLFHELVSLHYHRKKIHTGERPHKCEVCGRAFILSSDLKKHQNIHIKDNGETVVTPPEVTAARARRLVRRSKFQSLVASSRGINNHKRKRKIEDPSDEIEMDGDSHSGHSLQNSELGVESDEFRRENEDSSEDEDRDNKPWLEPEVHMSYVDERIEFSE